MPKSKIPSPARSQGGITTPKRKTTRGSRSLCSPALSTASGRLTSLIDQFKDKNMESFALSPLNGRSVLNDNTEIEEPRRKSWWKKLDENSQYVMEVLEDNKLTDVNVEELIDIEVLSQEKKNYTLDLPESSDNESINSIVLPQRKLFTQKENQPQKNYGHLIDNRESLAKLHKTKTTNIDKTINVGTRELFQNKRSKPIFPAALLIISPNKTAGDTTKENVLPEPKAQVRNIFGNRPANKRKNMFADFIVSESEDEIPDIQPKVFGFQKKLEQRRISSVSKGRDGSPTSSITITDMEMDDWKLLPSSTMVENQLEENMVAGHTPIKRARLSKLSEAKESETGINTLQTNTTGDKTKQSNKSISSKKKSKSSEIKDRSLNNSRITRSMLKNTSNENTSIKQNAKKNKSQSKISPKDVCPSKSDMDKQNTTLNKSQKQNKSKTRNSPKAIENERESDENTVNVINNVTRVINKSNTKNVSNTSAVGKSVNEKECTVTLKVNDEVVEATSKDVEQNSADDKVDGNQEQDFEQNQVVQDEKMVSQEIIKTVNNIHENEKEQNVSQENDQDKEIGTNLSQENESEHNANEDIASQENDEHDIQAETANESQEVENESDIPAETANRSQEVKNESKPDDTEAHVSQEDDDDQNKSHEETANLSQEDDDDQNKSHEETAYVSQEDDDDQNKSHEETANESQDAENASEIEEEANQSDEEAIENDDDANASDVHEDEAHESQEIEAEVNESQEMEEVNESQEKEDLNESQHIVEKAHKSKENDEEAHESHVNEDDDVPDEDDENAMDEEANESREIEASINESQEVENDDEESETEANESQEIEEDQEMDDSDEADKAIASDPEISDDNDNQADDMEVDDDDENEQESENDEENEASHEEIQNEIEPSAEEIGESPNITHDTTGRHRKKDLNNSPEAILFNKTNQMDSFTAKGRNTSVRKTKSMIKIMNIEPSLAPPRDSIGFSDGTRNSSAEGSGWDSHRTTRKTLRQTFGKDFTPRKSLRALVMEKSAKRQTEHIDMHSETVKFPLANSTEMPDDCNDQVDDIVESEHEVSDHEASRCKRLETLKMHLQKIKQQNIEKRLKMKEAVHNSLKAPAKYLQSLDSLYFKVPNKPAPRRPKVTQSKPKKKLPSFISMDDLPSEVIEDMKYKPPKRFRPSNASWITKRLYKFLEDKLEPKYDYKARVRAEKLVETLYHFAKDLRRHQVAPADSVEVLKHEFARLEIVRTHFEFYRFFHDFMPREVRVKVNPDVVNNIPLPRHGVFSDILRGNAVQ